MKRWILLHTTKLGIWLSFLLGRRTYTTNVLQSKRGRRGHKRYKERLVVKGFRKQKGIEFDEIFSPIVKMTSIQTILSLVVVEDLHMEQMDFKIDFLH